ncbi:hypothetical protein STAFG_4937 [Streptomyces afghaniensis 772]|uniref:Uncharacterized protein n=1 Tax=Streptomyces afghaniensis 772 TaxID=1283301 RepID=S4MEU4_9ACTN|nr:hypothetical protein STAFG_4937 [Streptomyces afghaniensis 772]
MGLDGSPESLAAARWAADDAENALLQAASESEMLVPGSRGLEPAESSFPSCRRPSITDVARSPSSLMTDPGHGPVSQGSPVAASAGRVRRPS